MHLSEGVLHTPILLAGAVLAVAGIAVGLRRLESERLPLTALFAAAFFVAGTIHVPVGIGSVHLILNGMAGLFLGWAVFPAFLIALLLQVIFFWWICRVRRQSLCDGNASGDRLLSFPFSFTATNGIKRSLISWYWSWRNWRWRGRRACFFCADVRWWKKLSESCLALASLSSSGIYFG